MTRLSIFLLLPLLGACASLTHRSRHQYVLVRSDPPGAQIIDHGEPLGTTPRFVELRRRRSSWIELQTTNQTVSLPLSSKYRWVDSFWSNFIFLTYVPVGWTIDLLTGSAWSLIDPPIVKMAGRGAGDLSRSSTRLAFAPPQASSAALSDDAAKLWYERLTRRPGENLLPYTKTLSSFIAYHYDFDRKPDIESEHELFARLGLDEVFESEVFESDGEIRLQGARRNVYSGEKSGEQTITAIRTLTVAANQRWYERYHTWFHLLPNTPSVEWSSSDIELASADGTKYVGEPTTDSSFVGQVSPYLSVLSITRLQSPRREGNSEFRFQIVPALRLAYGHLHFPSFAAISDVEFRYLRLGIGLGPEIGWQYRAHTIYFNIIPIYGLHKLGWTDRAGNHNRSIGAVTSRVELGYLNFLNDNWNFRVFTKSTSTPEDLWNSAIHDANPSAPQVTSGNDISAGISVGYTFDARPDFRRWEIQ